MPSEGRAWVGRSAAKDRRRDDLERAILRLQRAKTRLSIAAVAREAGVTAPLLHNTYPDIAEKVRALAGKNIRVERDAKHQEVIKLREMNRALRAEKEKAEADVRRLASLLEAMRFEVAQLRSVASGKVSKIVPN